MWKAPIGFLNSGERKTSNLITEEPYASHISKAFELLDQKYLPHEAVKVLKDNGFRTKSGKIVGVRELGKILRKVVYKGMIPAFGKVFQGAFKPLVDADRFDRVQAILAGRNQRQPKYSMVREDFPLRKFLACSCGRRYLGSWSKGRSKRYAHYHCRSCKKSNVSPETVHAEFQNFLHQHAVGQDFAGMLKIAIEENMRSSTESTESKRSKLARRILELQGEQDAIAQKNISGIVDDETARRMIAFKKKSIVECEYERVQLPSASQQLGGVIEYGLRILQDPRTAWDKFSLLQKQRFQILLFPDGVTFANGKCGSAKTSLILQTQIHLREEGGLVVTPRGVEPRLQA